MFSKRLSGIFLLFIMTVFLANCHGHRWRHHGGHHGHHGHHWHHGHWHR